VTKRSRLSRGDRNRNRRLERLRELVPTSNAVLGIDLAERKQAAALVDHDSRVLARQRLVCRSWQLGSLLDWALRRAREQGFTSVTVACEATGHWWQVLERLAAERGLPFVCVQGLLVARARESEDLTFDKSDPKDAMVIARLTTQLCCYEPERSDTTWSRLRQLGTRRVGLMTEMVACGAQMRELLGCVWPAALATARRPTDSAAWCASMVVVLRGAKGGDLEPVRRRGYAQFEAAVRRELPVWGARLLCSRIVKAVFAALDDPVGLVGHRHGALERAELVIEDWRRARIQREDIEARMVSVLDQLELTELVTSIPGLSAVGAASLLAETGDPTRFASPRALVKHAGLCPRDNSSGERQGKGKLSGRGRPELRVAAWRLVWGAQHGNPVLAARHTHLTTRDHNRLAGGQAHVACAATLLRWVHAIVCQRTPWDPEVAAGHRPAPARAQATTQPADQARGAVA
jgi:transposase